MARSSAQEGSPLSPPLRIALVLALLSGPAHADEWRLYGEVLTEVPIQVGAKLIVEGPRRIRAGTSVGWMPGAYVDMINGLMVATDVYTEETADLIDVALNNSLLWRTHVGWRPVEDLGSYVEVSYTLMGLGGGVSGEDALTSGADLPPPVASDTEAEFNLDSATHMMGVEAGYVWEWDSGITLRAGMGLLVTLDANFGAEATGGEAGKEEVEGATEDYLDGIFERWVHPPYFAFAAGYRFL